MSYRVAIVGSRTFNDEKIVRDYVRRLPLGSTVVSGGCNKGPDKWAVDEATKRGLDVVVFAVDKSGLEPYPNGRKEFAKRAFARNKLIATGNEQHPHPDWLIAFWSPPGRGTINTINHAAEAMVPWARVCLQDGEWELHVSAGVRPEQMLLYPRGGN